MITKPNKLLFIYSGWLFGALVFLYAYGGWNRPLSAWILDDHPEVFYDSEFGYYSMALSFLKKDVAIFFQHPGVITQFFGAKLLALFPDPYHSTQSALNVGRLVSVLFFGLSALHFFKVFIKTAGAANCLLGLSLMFLHPGLTSILTEFPNSLSLAPAMSLLIISMSYAALQRQEKTLRTWAPIGIMYALALAINLNFLGVILPILFFIFFKANKKLPVYIGIIIVIAYSVFHGFNSLYIFSPLVHALQRLIGETINTAPDSGNFNFLGYSVLIPTIVFFVIALRRKKSLLFLPYFLGIQLLFILITNTSNFDLYFRYFLPQCGAVAVLYVIAMGKNFYPMPITLMLCTLCLVVGGMVNYFELNNRHEIGLEARERKELYPPELLSKIESAESVWLVSAKPGFFFDVAQNNEETASLYYASYFYADENIFMQETGLEKKFTPVVLPGNTITTEMHASQLPFFLEAVRENHNSRKKERQKLLCKLIEAHCEKLFWWVGRESFVRAPYSAMNTSVISDGTVPDLILVSSQSITYSVKIVEALEKDFKTLFPSASVIIH